VLGAFRRVRRRLHRHDERSAELRLVRQGVRCRLFLQRRKVRLPCGSLRVQRRLRRSGERSGSLRKLWFELRGRQRVQRGRLRM
jgi:hypothetical protein